MTLSVETAGATPSRLGRGHVQLLDSIPSLYTYSLLGLLLRPSSKSHLRPAEARAWWWVFSLLIQNGGLTQDGGTGQMPIWSEQSSPENLDSIVWPRLAVAAEIFWTGATLPDGSPRLGM